MRSQSEPPGVSAEGDARSIPSSPSGSTATGLSGGSSLGLQYKGAWCTPPRIFVEHQVYKFVIHDFKSWFRSVIWSDYSSTG